MKNGEYVTEESGWLLKNGEYVIDWEEPDKQVSVTQSLNQIMNGCKCKTGCSTARCHCKKANTFCSPGNYCINCCNMPASSLNEQDDTENCDEPDTEENIETEVVTDCINDSFIDLLA